MGCWGAFMKHKQDEVYLELKLMKGIKKVHVFAKTKAILHKSFFFLLQESFLEENKTNRMKERKKLLEEEYNLEEPQFILKLCLTNRNFDFTVISLKI